MERRRRLGKNNGLLGVGAGLGIGLESTRRTWTLPRRDRSRIARIALVEVGRDYVLEVGRLGKSRGLYGKRHLEPVKSAGNLGCRRKREGTQTHAKMDSALGGAQ